MCNSAASIESTALGSMVDDDFDDDFDDDDIHGMFVFLADDIGGEDLDVG